MRPADLRRFERDLKKPLEHFQNELKKSARQAQVQERAAGGNDGAAVSP
jgi:hypothetical protein